MRKAIVLFLMLAAVILVAQEKSTIVVKDSGTYSGVIVITAAMGGKTIELQCNQGSGSCVPLKIGNYAMVQVAEALAKAGVKLVPDIVAGGGNGGGTLVDVLLANVIRDGRSQRALAKRRDSPKKANPARSARCGSSCVCSPIAASSVFRTPENPHCSPSFPQHGRRSRTIRLRRSNRNSV